MPTYLYTKYLCIRSKRDPYPFFFYDDPVQRSRQRNRAEMEYELLIQASLPNRYFDVFVEYAKADAN